MFPLAKVSAIMPVTATCDCLPWPPWEARNDPVSVEQPNVAKASTIVNVTCHCCQPLCLKNLANVHKPLVNYELVVAQLVEHRLIIQS